MMLSMEGKSSSSGRFVSLEVGRDGLTWVVAGRRQGGAPGRSMGRAGLEGWRRELDWMMPFIALSVCSKKLPWIGSVREEGELTLVTI
jgi:hypothetical protein